MASPSTLVQQVSDLVSLPDVYLKVRGLMDDPGSSIDDFTAAIELDTALSARVLRMANSAFFGFSAKIDNISRAINIMGVSQLHDLILATTATTSFSGIDKDLVDMERFWSSCIQCAILARLLAADSQIIDSDRLFVAGLLYDIGHLVMFSLEPVAATEILKRAEEENTPVHVIESEVLGFTSAELGAELLHVWHLPESFIEIVRCQHRPAEGGRYLLDTCILHIARTLIGEIPPADSETGLSLAFAMQHLGYQQDDLMFLLRESRLHFEETRALIMPDSVGQAA